MIGRRQSGQGIAETSQQRGAGGFGRELEVAILERGEDEAIDRGPHTPGICRVLDGWHGVTPWCLERPVGPFVLRQGFQADIVQWVGRAGGLVLTRGALVDPCSNHSLLGGGQFWPLGWHAVRGQHAPQATALGSVESNHRALGIAGEDASSGREIQASLGLAAGMATGASGLENWQDRFFECRQPGAGGPCLVRGRRGAIPREREGKGSEKGQSEHRNPVAETARRRPVLLVAGAPV